MLFSVPSGWCFWTLRSSWYHALKESSRSQSKGKAATEGKAEANAPDRVICKKARMKIYLLRLM